jgi:ferredoxin-type protein NapH
MKKYLLILGVFLLVFGIACATEEMVGCILMPISGVLYFFGTTSKKVFSFFNMEVGKYLVMAGTFIIITSFIFLVPEKNKELQNSIKGFKLNKVGIWKKRRLLFQIFILGLITFHIILVHFRGLNIPSICPRSSTDLATTSGLFGLSAVYWLIMYLLVFIWGRVICSWFCVYSFVQERSNDILSSFNKKVSNIVKNNFIIYIITSVFWGSVIYNIAKYYLTTNSLEFNIVNGYKVANLWVFYGGMITLLPLTMFLSYYFGNRFFCKYVCPVGGLMSLYSRFSILKIKINHDKCKNCKKCTRTCQMGVDIDRYIKENNVAVSDNNCIVCGDCIDACKFSALEYGLVFKQPSYSAQQISNNTAITVKEE